MCGICGFVLDRSISEERFGFSESEVLNRLSHRGPDDKGWAQVISRGEIDDFEDFEVGIGMTRLEIVGGEGGKQPMSSGCGLYSLVFNGEITNHHFLRRMLSERYGLQFSSTSDAEVVLKGYQVENTAFFSRLSGMYAFVIVDLRAQTVVFHRDPLGIKPLFLKSFGNAGVIFGSELVAFPKHQLKNVVTETGCYSFFQKGYSRAENLFESVTSLAPGSTVLFAFRGGALGKKIERRESLKPQVKKTKVVGYRESLKKFRNVFLQAVERNLDEEKRVSLLLSGGLDSNIIMHSVTKILGRDIEPVCLRWGLSDPEYEIAKASAKSLGADLEYVDFDPQWFKTNFRRLFISFSEPFAGGISAGPVYQKVNELGIKIALTGVGGDELFGNYGKALSKTLRQALGRFALRVKAGYGVQDSLNGSFYWPDYMPQRKAKKIFSFDVDYVRSDSTRGIENDWLSINEYDFRNILVEEYLKSADRLSMAFGVEARPVFLDRDVVKCTLDLPVEYRTLGKYGKDFLVDCFSDILPRNVLTAKKRGFPTPFAKIIPLFKHDLIAYCDPTLAVNMRFFKRSFIERLRRELERNLFLDNHFLWSFLWLHVFFEEYPGGEQT